MINFKDYINGEFFDTETKVEIVSPLNLEAYGTVPSLSANDIDFAFKSARSAFKGWRDTSLDVREAKLKAFNELLYNAKDELAEIMRNEIGKNIDECKTEIIRTCEYLDKTFTSWRDNNTKEEIIGTKTSIQKRVPLGVVLAISPFNYPVNLSLAKIGPALLVGNTVVFKAATNGSLVGGKLAELFAKVDLPKGVFNYVSGKGRDIGDILTAHKEIDMVTFTGGVRVGKHIGKQINMKSLVLELGGNDAAYIRHDADLNIALKETMAGAFGFAGQRCTAIKRVIVHELIADKFIKLLTEATNKLDPMAVIDVNASNFVKSLYDESVLHGDKILCGGEFKNNWVTPTLIKTDPTTKVWNEEPFGPILPIVIVKNDDEAIDLINDSTFGLQNSIFTEDHNWAIKIAPLIDSGTVNINAKSSRGPDEFPFSGIKNSGFGTQGIKYALESMTRILNIVDNKK